MILLSWKGRPILTSLCCPAAAGSVIHSTETLIVCKSFYLFSLCLNCVYLVSQTAAT